MAHHRCTGCKQESHPRHKWQGGVYCDDCIREIRGFRPRPGASWFGSIWGRFTGFFGNILHPGAPPKHLAKDRERASHARLKALEAWARDIPFDPQGGTPGKH